MNRRDRAQLVVAELELKSEDRVLSSEEIAVLIGRAALSASEAPKLEVEVLRELRARGYDVPAPQVPARFALLGLGLLAFWALAVLGVLWLLNVV